MYLDFELLAEVFGHQREKQFPVQSLERYVENNGFNWPFVAPGSEFSQNLSLLTSKMVLDPTATPVIIVDPNGKFHMLAGEIKSSSFLLTEINKHSN